MSHWEECLDLLSTAWEILPAIPHVFSPKYHRREEIISKGHCKFYVVIFVESHLHNEHGFGYFHCWNWWEAKQEWTGFTMKVRNEDLALQCSDWVLLKDFLCVLGGRRSTRYPDGFSRRYWRKQWHKHGEWPLGRVDPGSGWRGLEEGWRHRVVYMGAQGS